MAVLTDRTDRALWTDLRAAIWRVEPRLSDEPCGDYSNLPCWSPSLREVFRTTFACKWRDRPIVPENDLRTLMPMTVRQLAWCCTAIAMTQMSAPAKVPQNGVYESWLDRYDLLRPARIVALPAELREVSGLAIWNSAHLLAHNDERSSLFVIRIADGRIVREIGIGQRRGLRGDYEDIVRDGSQGFLVASDGAILEFALDDTSSQVSAREETSMRTAACEVEAVARALTGPGLVAACKHEAGKLGAEGMLVLRWSQRNGYDSPASFRVPWDALGDRRRRQRFTASGMTPTPDGKSWLLVDGIHGRIAELTGDGRVIAVRALPQQLLPQVEGIVFGTDGTLYLASEGRRGAGVLAVYPRTRR